MVVHHGERLGERDQSFLGLAVLSVRFRQQRQIRGPSQIGAGGPIRGHALAELRDAFRVPALLHQRPGQQDAALCPPLGKSLLDGERDQGLGMLLGGVPLLAVLKDDGGEVQRKGQAERMRELPG